MIDKYTAQAATAEAAIEKGLKALGLKREEANIEITEPGKKGFLGIGQKDAVVVVKRKQATSIMDEVFARPALGSEPETLEAAPEAEERTLVAASETSGAKEASEPIAEPVAESPEEVEATAAETSSEADSREEEHTKEPAVPTEEEIQAKEQKDAEGIQFVADYLMDVTRKMGVSDVAVHVSREGKKVQYNIDTEDAGLVIGRHGKVLNSLQTLAQIQLHQVADTKLYAKVDAEEYRERRQKTVEQLAKRTADKVKRTRQPVILEPMPAHERKLIHRYLNHHKGIETHSEGKEPHRYLVVEPE